MSCCSLRHWFQVLSTPLLLHPCLLFCCSVFLSLLIDVPIGSVTRRLPSWARYGRHVRRYILVIDFRLLYICRMRDEDPLCRHRQAFTGHPFPSATHHAVNFLFDGWNGSEAHATGSGPPFTDVNGGNGPYISEDDHRNEWRISMVPMSSI